MVLFIFGENGRKKTYENVCRSIMKKINVWLNLLPTIVKPINIKIIIQQILPIRIFLLKSTYSGRLVII